MAKGITSSYTRAAQAVGEYQSSIYDAMSQGDIAAIKIGKEEEEWAQRSALIDFGAEAIRTGDLLIDLFEEKKDIVEGVAEAEKVSGYKIQYNKDTFLDVLSGKSKFKNLGKENYKLGGVNFTREDMIALGKTAKKNKFDTLFVDDPEAYAKRYKGEASGWKYGEEALASEGTQRQGLELSLASTEEHGNIIGGIIYGGGEFEGKTLKGRGLGEWASKHFVYDDYYLAQFGDKLSQEEFEKAMQEAKKTVGPDKMDSEDKVGVETNISYEDYQEFKRNRKALTSDTTTKEMKEKAEENLKKLYRKFSDKVEWDEVKGFIKEREGIYNESLNLWDINRNKEGLGFDLGPYQINTGWLLPNEMGGLWEKTLEGGNYALYDMVNAYLSDIVKDAPIQTDNRFYGKKEGFDIGDIFGRDSIFTKYRNEESINPFIDDEEQTKRKKVLMEAGLIDEYYRVYDTNT